MRLAYLILSHQLPNQVVRLVRTLRDRGDSFFIHVDPRAEPATHAVLREQLEDDAAVHFVPPHSCHSGSFGILEATIEGLRTVMKTGTAFDRVLLLSGQDYPIKPRRYIKAFLERQNDQEFIESFPLTAANRGSEQADPDRGLKRVLRWHINVRSRFLHIPIRRSLPARMKPHGGSQWWCLTRACIEHVYRSIQSNPGIIDYFKPAFIPDELFFQTLVSNSPFADRVTGSSLTYEDWDTSDPAFRAVLDQSYLPILASSHKLFARKFDPTKDAEILDRIDQSMLQMRANARSVSARVPSGARPGQSVGHATQQP